MQLALRRSAGGEGVLVDDEDAAGFDVLEARLEGGGVHGDEGVEAVAGRVDFGAAELDLEAGDAGQGADRGANLGGEVGEGADVVAEVRRGAGELRADELHSVAGVAAKTDGRLFQRDERLIHHWSHDESSLPFFIVRR